MSPEQLKEGSKYGQSSDIWAAGVILFEMFAKFRPFETKDDIINNSRKAFPKHVPEDIRKLILNLLDTNPRERKTAQDIHKWLCK